MFSSNIVSAFAALSLGLMAAASPIETAPAKVEARQVQDIGSILSGALSSVSPILTTIRESLRWPFLSC